ncbi:MAG: MCE family protein [Muribaculaceae bacterium]|nr:MCE family protein [Muribaculaceae bacterium]
MKRFKKELVIGVMVVVSIVILVFGIDYLKGVNIFHTANYYFATYENVAGLTQSAPVTINGFRIGQVRELKYEFDNPGHVRVELDIDPKLRLPKGTKAVLSSSLLGSAGIVLVCGTSNEYYESGATIEGVVDPGVMGAVTEELMPAAADMLPKLDSILTAVNRLVSDPALVAAVQSLDNIAAGLETSTQSLAIAMKPVPALTNDAAAAMVDVKVLAANLEKISNDLAEVSAALKEAPIGSTLNNVGKLSENLVALSNQLNNPNSSLGLLMRDPKLYNNLNSCVAHIDSVLVDLKKRPKDYIPPIKLF